MIPSVLAQQLKQGVEDFLKTTFPVSSQHFHGVIDDLLERDGGVFKGPYLSIQLPFKTGSGKTDYFTNVPLTFPPYYHQEQAFSRLSGLKPQSTIVATGTGSGKTESFLIPILDYCYHHRGEQGIKAILIYPMNALASDQASRIAKLIFTNPYLKVNITAGLYVGQSEKEPHVVMSQENIISNKDILRNSPPDILLTNYKMLDYLLIQAKDYPLWQNNKPETLRFLVVDELHTFDGAQGSDLACLIRRLKARLKTPEHFLCCVGTSATLGSDAEKSTLIKYASDVFGEWFNEHAVIMESRKSAGEFLENSLITRTHIVLKEQAEKLMPDYYDGYKQYIIGQHALWFGETIAEKDFDQIEWRIDLSEKLLGHSFFQNLLKVLKGEIKGYDEILFDMQKFTPEFKNADIPYCMNTINSLLALISTARSGSNESPRPFLNVRYQLWLRELRRMVGLVSQEPRLAFADDLTTDQLKNYLPVIHCRDCNSMGWAGLRRIGDNDINSDLQSFYTAFFRNDLKVTFLFPETAEIQDLNKNLRISGEICHICSECLHLTQKLKPKDCPNCGHNELIRLFIPNTISNRSSKRIGHHNCPYCEGHNSLTILGSRAASLTSVLITQLYASSFNDDKKLLTFSDSVQDAAHRAGFFAGRTYRFNFRSSLQQFVEAYFLTHSNPLTLDKLPGLFNQFWTDQMDDKTFVSTFLAPNMSWFPDYDLLKKEGRLPKDSNLMPFIKKRIEWEIISEYGFRARIGRTLEKTSSSVAHVDTEKLTQIIDMLLPNLQNKIGGLKNLKKQSLKRFIIGFLTHMKNQGGIYYHELDDYIQRWGEPYVVNMIPWMPNFSQNARTPAFLSTKPSHRFDHLLSAKHSRMSWYESWADKCFSSYNPLISELIGDMYDMVIHTLIKENVLIEKNNKGDRIWGIQRSVLCVSDHVVQFTCKMCRHNVSAPFSEKEIWQDADCLKFNCNGKYQEQLEKIDYYGTLYGSGHIQRIFAAEHTGLLERDDRQELENRFKSKDRAPWDPNLLSCTPTLELGIDIGELSSVILCSVPPAQANYLQRIGRAGRQDGNALNVTVANAAPHDLYFYAEPETMLSGKVDPPGIFLNASAVIERQFTAFCFDKWVETGLSLTAVPLQLRQVFAGLTPLNIKKFPHNFLNFIEMNQTLIFDAFIIMFANNLTDDSIDYLKKFIEGDKDTQGKLAVKIIDRLHYHYKERESLKKKVNFLKGKIQKKKDEPVKDKNYQAELDDLIREKNGLHSIVTRINDRQTLNFFTDEGLLPNYAFPEAGVMLRSVIYRRKSQPVEEGSKYDIFTYDYERSASSAISELAPASSFYAGGRKVSVDQIDLSVSEVEIWRLCDQCSYMAMEDTTKTYAMCPQCGSTLWADAGQKRQMIRMRQMFANTSDRNSRISDDNEERDTTFYNKQMLVRFNDNDITDAYKIDHDDFPFGFQFLSKATFSEINFGEQNDTCEKVTIGGVDLPRKGFIICKYCGKVQDHKGEIKHALSCASRKKDSEKNLTECVYLYREFTSEAILLLLPVTTFEGSDKKLHSFIAGVHLGLKHMFGGNIDHLQTALHEEPVPESTYRKKYLALYDTVPGGTGYLKQLMRSKHPLMDLIEGALNMMRSCACNQNPDKDGCYLCLFAYRRSYNMEGTSRDQAIQMFSDILSLKDHIVQTKNLKDIKINSLVESELEAKFIEALRRFRKDDLPMTLKKEIVNGKPGYFCKVGGKAWYIELQVNLGKADGITIPSRADFVFRPARLQQGEKPIAIFTDGFFCHKKKIGQDMAQRCAILRSGKFHVWSLTWKDITNCFKHQGSHYENWTQFSTPQKQKTYKQLAEAYGVDHLTKTSKMDSFQCLMLFLQRPEALKWTRHSFIQAMMHLDLTNSLRTENWIQKLTTYQPEEIVDAFKDYISIHQESCYFGCFEPVHDKAYLKLFVAIHQEGLKKTNPSDMFIACSLEDSDDYIDGQGFESVWNGYLRLFNFMQFIPNTYFTTRQVKSDSNLFENLRPIEPDDKQAAKWEDLKELIDPAYYGLLDFLAENDLPEPEIGHELMDDKGKIIADAEVAWIDHCIAFLLPDQMHFSNLYIQRNWRVYNIETVLAESEMIIKLFNNTGE